MSPTPEEMRDIGLMAAELAATGGDVGEFLQPCPRCAAQVHVDFRAQWRPVTEVARVYLTTPENVRREICDAGGRVDLLDRVLVAVPFLTCSSCGIEYDGTQEPPT